MSESGSKHKPQLPHWLRRPAASCRETVRVKKLLRRAGLVTVCEEARCPNIAECFGCGTATFMILGDICTRNCTFCSICSARPVMGLRECEAQAERVAEAAKQLSLKHVVVTSVTRDDLADGGAGVFVKTISALREILPDAAVEVLIPDFGGSDDALRKVVEAAPDVLNHNLETVPRIYREVRPGADYERSLKLLERAKQFNPSLRTKTGIMLGLGEEPEEVFSLMNDARSVGVDIFTAGQYLQPTRKHRPVHHYLEQAQYERYRHAALARGFSSAFVGPLVRSSYHAAEALERHKESVSSSPVSCCTEDCR